MSALVFLAPLWLRVGAVALALGVWALTWRSARGPTRRLPEGLAALGLAGLALATARPAWEEEVERARVAKTALLIDGSRSMALLDEAGSPWAARVAEVRAELGDDVEVFYFDSELHRGEPLEFDGDDSQIGRALAALAAGGTPYAGVVLVSDGLDRGPLRARFREEGRLAPLALPGPLTVYAAGAAMGDHTLAVSAVEAPSVAYSGTPLPVRVQVQGLGWEGASVPVQLVGAAGVLAAGEVKLDDQGRGELRIEATLRGAGTQVLWVELPAWRGDADAADNRAPVVVRVLRDRLRVLHVAGAPSWDVKFLRRFLEEDPSVEMVSFFILRTTADMNAGWGPRELSLIPFPYRELLTDELHKFDVVILQNFNQEPYLEGDVAVLGGLRAWVEEGGGGLALVGGPLGGSAGGYQNTPIAEILPVSFGDQPVWTPAPTPLVPVDVSHPVLQLAERPEESAEAWAKLGAWSGYNPVATVLGEVLLRAEGGAPLLAVREPGQGRTLALLGDESWRWSFEEAGKGRGNQVYLQFWKGALRWLARDPATQAVRLEVDRLAARPGEEVALTVVARGAGFRPEAGAEVEVNLTREGAVAETLRGITGVDGAVRLGWRPDQVGTWALAASARVGARALGEDAGAVAVTGADPERLEHAPDLDFLQALAAQGRYYPPGASGPPRLRADATWVERESRLVEWGHHPALLGAVMAALALAWWTGRREGRL